MKNLSVPPARVRGFSIVELLVVLAIIGMMVLVGMPNFMTYRNINKTKTSLRNFTSDVRNARQRAITRNVPMKVSFTTGGREYRIYELPQGGDWTQFGPTRQLDDSVYFHTTSTFTDLTTNGDDDTDPDVVFTPSGTVGNLPAATGTIVLRTDKDIPKPEITVSFWATGRMLAN
jgi:prepilin-type N-terminal cleavage/methylation domain-containing protein